MPDELSINCETARRVIVDFIGGRFEEAGFARAVMGLSGGLDSAVVAVLAGQALGAGQVTCLLLPYGQTPADVQADVEAVAALAGAELAEMDLRPQIDPYFAAHPQADRLRRGNKIARERMAILYDHAAMRQALVVGTTNRTEWLLGYFTMWGDMGAALWPLAGVYKTQVRELARHLGVPEEIIARPPTAGLWDGQTDEGDLGVTYDQADRILHRLVDLELNARQVIAEGFPAAAVERVIELMRCSEFKRHLPAVPDLAQSAPEDDFI